MASVLIVDDHQGTLDTYSTALRLAGFDTATASTGEVGIGIASSRNFDVILIDLRLPDMSGIDVIRNLKLNGVKSRVVIITVFAAFESAFDAASAGADGYVNGMLFGDEVVEVVVQALAGSLSVGHPTQRRLPESAEATQEVAASVYTIDPRVRKVMRVIDADLAASRSVAELAAQVGWSKSSLSHRFQASVGISITGYRSERRLIETARRLLATHRSIREIAYSVGYRSYSLADFRKHFRKRFGMSPKEYRRACLWPVPSASDKTTCD